MKMRALVCGLLLAAALPAFAADVDGKWKGSIDRQRACRRELHLQG